MGDLSRSQQLRANERIKHITIVLTALGNASIIGVIAKLQLKGEFHLADAFWMFGSLWLIWLASMTLTLLRSEEEI